MKRYYQTKLNKSDFLDMLGKYDIHKFFLGICVKGVKTSDNEGIFLQGTRKVNKFVIEFINETQFCIKRMINFFDIFFSVIYIIILSMMLYTTILFIVEGQSITGYIIIWSLAILLFCIILFERLLAWRRIDIVLKNDFSSIRYSEGKHKSTLS